MRWGGNVYKDRLALVQDKVTVNLRFVIYPMPQLVEKWKRIKGEKRKEQENG